MHLGRAGRSWPSTCPALQCRGARPRRRRPTVSMCFPLSDPGRSASPSLAAHLDPPPLLRGPAVTPRQGSRPTFPTAPYCPRSKERGAGPRASGRAPSGWPGRARGVPARPGAALPAPPPPAHAAAPRESPAPPHAALARRQLLPSPLHAACPPVCLPACLTSAPLQKRTANFGLLPPSTPSPSPQPHTPLPSLIPFSSPSL